MSIVSILQAEKYEAHDLRASIDSHFETLGVESDLRPGMKVLIKPNLVLPRRPDQAATTHPLILLVICQWLRERGITDITIVDSPGGPHVSANLKTVYSVSGMNSLADVALLNLDTGYSSVKCPEGFLNRSFNILDPILNADYIINVAKLKTHSMMVLSAGIKNLFGAIPGLQKPEMHYRFPDPQEFSRMLLEVAQTVKPQVTVIDAVDAMEGNGPNSGTKRHMGLIFASRDVFAQDWTATCLMGIDPYSVPMLRIALESGLFKADDIEILGCHPCPAEPPFKLPDSINYDLLKFLPPVIRRPLTKTVRGLLRPIPKVDTEKCIGCGKCAESCPQKIISMKNGKMTMNNKKCISCFCCQEMCPVHAIGVKRKWKV